MDLISVRLPWLSNTLYCFGLDFLTVHGQETHIYVLSADAAKETAVMMGSWSWLFCDLESHAE